MPTTDSCGEAIISASCPGGMARQFRVQVGSAETPSHWKLIASFRDAQTAGEVAVRLSKAGQQTRVVACRALPTAA